MVESASNIGRALEILKLAEQHDILAEFGKRS
jgi:hypothetical protein